MTGHDAGARHDRRRVVLPAARCTLLATLLVACGTPAAKQPTDPPSRLAPSDGPATARATASASASGAATARMGGRGAATPTPSGRPAPSANSTPQPQAVAVAPPAGRYVYQASGCTSCGSVGYRAVPSTVVSDVSDQGGGSMVTVVTSTVVDSSNSSTSTVDLSTVDAREVHVTTHGDVGPVAYTSDLTPQPPFLVAPLPLRPGQSWQISWQDTFGGTTADGTGQTVDEETVSTPLGNVDTYLVEIKLKLQSSQYTATTDNRVWIDPNTHVTVKWRDQRTIQSAAGTGQYDVTAVLSSGPAA